MDLLAGDAGERGGDGGEGDGEGSTLTSSLLQQSLLSALTLRIRIVPSLLTCVSRAARPAAEVHASKPMP